MPQAPPILLLFAAIYFVAVIAMAAYHFQHGWSHAEEDRKTAAKNARLCEENQSLMNGHNEKCRHDMADQHMSSIWFGIRNVGTESTLCLPTSCADWVGSFSSALGVVGMLGVASAVGALVCIYIAMILFNRFKLEQAIGPAADRPRIDYPDRNIEYRPSDNVRYRLPRIEEEI